MNKIHKRRLYYLGFFAVSITIATSLILYALKQNINLFLTPTQLTHVQLATDYHFRLGGMVKPGSLIRRPDQLTIKFIATDFKHEVNVRYQGILPDLFREGKSMIAEGHLSKNKEFIASQILAKHDEKYLPQPAQQFMRTG
jgi:cytochrome c-type biogenesis protein CcmE